MTAHAFGPLAGQTLELAPGMTVVSGVNESAKSSWHAALYAGLCGRRRGKGASSREDRRFSELHRPWDGGGWEVSCVLELADGRIVELRHDLEGKVDCRAIDRLTGADVSREIISDGAPDAARWLGLDRRSFAATASVTQSELLSVLGAAEGLQAHVQRAAATAGTADGTASIALERLDRYAREQVGTDRAGSSKPLRRALDGVAAAQRGLATAREQHETYLVSEGAARTAREQADRAEALATQAAQRYASLQRTSALQAEAQIVRSAVEAAEDRVLESAQTVRALRQRYDEAERLQHRLTDGDLAALPAGDRSSLSGGLPSAIGGGGPDAREPRATVASDFSAGDVVAGEVVAGVVPTGDSAAGDLSVAADVAALATEFELAGAVGRRHRDARPAAVQIGDSSTAAAVRVGPNALRDLAARVDALTGLIGDSAGQIMEPDLGQRLTVRRIGLLASAALALAGVVLAGFGEVLPGLVLLVLAVATVAWAGRRRNTLSVSALVPAGLAPAQVDAARQQLQAVADRCRRLGVPPAAEELRRWAGQAERIADQQQEWLRWELDEQEHESRVRDLGERLCALIAAHDPGSVSGHPGDPERCLASYRQHCAERAEQRADSTHRVDVQWSRLQLLLGGETLVELHRRLLAAEQQHQQLVRHAGERTEALERVRSAVRQALAEADVASGIADEPADELADELAEGLDLPALVSEAARVAERARASAMVLLDEAGRCEGAARQHASSLVSVAEAEEQLAAAESALASIREVQRTLTLTRDFLARAQQRVHRDIAPVLARTLTQRLPEVTAGRYVEALVDPATLQVQVCGPDRRWRSADRLSVGTAEQVYLLLRIALATHLCAPGETCPLLLDDVTVQADVQRTVALLDMLLAEAADRQIVLFAQEPLVARWATERLTADDRHSLIALPTPA